MTRTTLTTPSREPIAVVGIGCRFPGGVNTVEDFWEVLLAGKSVVSEIPSDRFDATVFHDPDHRKHGSIRSDMGGFVKDIRALDADFFGYFPTEASRMDPQQRLALEASVHALEDSGTPLEKVAGSQTGVFIGTCAHDYASIQTTTEQRDHISPQVVVGLSGYGVANRVSHRLDLQGPSVTMDTACSSSLTALHMACQSLWTQESTMALAGGVNVILRPEGSIALSAAGFLSPDGACKPFDAAGNGYVRSEGMGVVFLKPLSQALRDQDRIYACVRGSLVNQDGYTPEGMTVPSLSAQARLLKSVYQQSGVNPTGVVYVEAHGPGTRVGDPIEANALGQELGKERPVGVKPLNIGSLKGNFGHLEGAAGIAAFIKAVMVTYHGQIPPQLNHKNPNPSIDFASLRLAVSQKTIDLTTSGQERWVGVNSFGAGGSNAHVILENAPVVSHPDAINNHGPRVFVLSARSHSSVQQMARNLAVDLEHRRPPLSDVAYTLNLRRSQHSTAAVIPATTLEELCERLNGFGRRQSPTFITRETSKRRPKTAFMFSGQGGQWLGMGSALADHDAVFSHSLAAFDSIFIPLAGFSIRAEMTRWGDQNIGRLNTTTVVQPATAAVQIALSRMLQSYGLMPEAVVGHSIGEVAAAHVAGALTLSDAVKIIYIRSQIQSRAAGKGSMLATGLSQADAVQVIQSLQLGGVVEVAALNGLAMTTLTGEVTGLMKIMQALEEADTFARFVNVDTPYHSRFMEPLEEDLIMALSSVQGRATEIPLYSTVTTSIEPGSHLTGDYWFKNIRQPVQYAKTATRMIEDGYDFLVEIGPHPVLVSGTRSIAAHMNRPVNIIPAMLRGQGTDPASSVMGTAHVLGINIDLNAFNGGGGRLIDLPLYPFQRQEYWYEHPDGERTRLGTSRHPFLKDSMSLTDDGRGSIALRLSTGVSPFLADHVIDGTIVFPMTAHLEAAYLAAQEIGGHADVWLDDLQINHPILLAPAEEFAPQGLLEITSPAGDFVISSRAADAAPTTPWHASSRGRIHAFDKAPTVDLETLQKVRTRVQTGSTVDVDEFYGYLDAAGLRYGELFRGIRQMWRLDTEVFASVQLPPSLNQEARRFRIHPALLDACLHGMFAYLHLYGDPSHIYVPQHLERVTMEDAEGATSAYGHIRVTHHDDTCLRCTILVYNEAGHVLAELRELTAKRLPENTSRQPLEYRTVFELEAGDVERVKVKSPQHIVILYPQMDNLGWLAPAMRDMFSRASTEEVRVDSTTSKWNRDEWGFDLDEDCLLVVPAFLSAQHPQQVPKALGVVMQALSRIAGWVYKQSRSPSVVVLTQGACLTEVDETCNPFSLSLEAASRVMANELPSARFRVVDLAMGVLKTQIAALQEELSKRRVNMQEMVVALRLAGRFVRRLDPVSMDEQRPSPVRLPARGGQYHAERSDEGSLDAIVMRPQPPIVLAREEVGIEVHATGINFKDVMNAMGLLDDRATRGGLAGQHLGLEVAGRVTELGPDVETLNVGDIVMAIVSDGLGGSVVAHRDRVAPIPSGISVRQAAAVPVAFVTAYYALIHLARLGDGETVLIHSAAGGVGLAAIQIAHMVGASVYATAGTPERRGRVADLGVTAVFDSRSLSIQEDVRAATDGRGVDVVLNSLTGPLLSQSVACLAPFGRFLELGKTDIYRNMRLGLEQLGDNCSFFVVDLDRLAGQKSPLYREMLAQVCKRLAAGQLQPLPTTSYDITQLSSALYDLSRSAVVGKAVIEMPAGSQVEATPTGDLSLRADRSYLITGGASGLGLQLARCLVKRGARSLVLVSRTGPKSAEDHTTIQDLRTQGIAVHLKSVDITDPAAVSSLIQSLADGPPLAGVIHSAGVLRDASAQDITMDDFWTVFGPKAIGAWYLSQATQSLALDFFVMISSVSSMLGMSGQTSYATANQFLDGLAYVRRSMGLPALSIGLGVLGEYAGMSRHSEHNDRIFDVLSAAGMGKMSLPVVWSAMERAIRCGTTQTTVVDINWSLFLQAYPQLAATGTFGKLAHETPDGRVEGSHARTPTEQRESISQRLQAGVAKIVGIDPQRISLTDTISRYGFDSLTLNQIRSMILRELRIAYPLLRLMEGPTLQEIAREIVG